MNVEFTCKKCFHTEVTEGADERECSTKFTLSHLNHHPEYIQDFAHTFALLAHRWLMFKKVD